MLAQLRDRLFERIDSGAGTSVLVLLDPNHPVSSTHPLHVDQLARREILPQIVAVQREDRISDPAAHPRLLVLRGPGDRGYPDEDLLVLTMDCAQKRRLSINGAYVCGWLVTDSRPEEVASQIRRNIVVNDTSVRRHRVVPLFEPHRMVLASQLASPQWISRWLGCIRSWLLIDACGQLREMHPVPYEAGSGVELPGPAFWQAQSRVKQAREVLLSMAKAGQMVPVDCEIRIDQALQAAYSTGLDDTEDVIFFAANHMMLPAGWHMHRAASACIANAVSGEQSLADGMASLSDAVLDELSLTDTAT